jgi:hypothetical protein
LGILQQITLRQIKNDPLSADVMEEVLDFIVKCINKNGFLKDNEKREV